MLKRTTTYTDYNGVERTEDFIFNLTKAEITEMQVETTGGLAEKLNQIIASKDAPAIMSFFKDFILKSYGEKSPDGKRIVKSKELSEAFSQTVAYDELFMELVTNAESASAFVMGVMPADMVEKANEQGLLPAA